MLTKCRKNKHKCTYLCAAAQPAWLRDEACDMAALPRILSEAAQREQEREAAREHQELGTLLYLAVRSKPNQRTSLEVKTVTRNLIFEVVFLTR